MAKLFFKRYKGDKTNWIWTGSRDETVEQTYKYKNEEWNRITKNIKVRPSITEIEYSESDYFPRLHILQERARKRKEPKGIQISENVFKYIYKTGTGEVERTVEKIFDDKGKCTKSKTFINNADEVIIEKIFDDKGYCIKWKKTDNRGTEEAVESILDEKSNIIKLTKFTNGVYEEHSEYQIEYYQ